MVVLQLKFRIFFWWFQKGKRIHFEWIMGIVVKLCKWGVNFLYFLLIEPVSLSISFCLQQFLNGQKVNENNAFHA